MVQSKRKGHGTDAGARQEPAAGGPPAAPGPAPCGVPLPHARTPFRSWVKTPSAAYHPARATPGQGQPGEVPQ